MKAKKIMDMPILMSIIISASSIIINFSIRIAVLLTVGFGAYTRYDDLLQLLIYPTSYFIIFLIVCRNAIIRDGLKQNISPKYFKSDIFIAGALLVITIGILLTHVIVRTPFDERRAGLLLQNDNIFRILYAIIITPVSEELLCRGIILEQLLKKYKPFISIFISSLLFAAIHLNVYQGVGAFFFGIILGWIYFHTRSLIICMFIHAINNAHIYIFYFGHLYNKAPVLSITSVFVIAVIAGWWLNKRFRPYPYIQNTVIPVTEDYPEPDENL